MEGRAGPARLGPRVRAVAARAGKLERAREYRGPAGQGLWKPHTPGASGIPAFAASGSAYFIHRLFPWH